MYRPTDYTEELAKEICDVIASNGRGLRKLCAERPHWPHRDTIYLWLKIHRSFSDQYVRAKQLQIDVLVDDLLDISDDGTNDYIANEKGELVVDTDHISRSRLRVDTRKWLASKLVPKVYGNKVQVEGNDDNKNDIDKVKEILNKCSDETV